MNVSCGELLDSQPTKHGSCYKETRRRTLSIILPCLFQRWKQRYLVLIGGFLYRFEGVNGYKMKGVPLPVDGILVSIYSDDRSIIEVASIYKTYRFRMESVFVAQAWLDAFSQRKAQWIREGLGHTPVPESLQRINRIAKSIYDGKMSIESRLVEEEVNNPLYKTM